MISENISLASSYLSISHLPTSPLPVSHLLASPLSISHLPASPRLPLPCPLPFSSFLLSLLLSPVSVKNPMDFKSTQLPSLWGKKWEGILFSGNVIVEIGS